MEFFFDTSAFIKAVREEPGSAWVRQTIRNPQNQIYLSRLVVAESFSVLGRLWRSGALTEKARDATANVIRQLLHHWRVHVRTISNHIGDSAGQLALTLTTPHYPQFVLRALDALQLASVLDIRQQFSEMVFVCSDQRLFAFAQAVAVPVIDPTTLP
jgi:uncharacterized protein with PIN domain